MDRRERYENLQVALKAMLAGFSSGLWVACPGIVYSFDPVKCTAVVDMAIKPKIRQPDGTWLDANPTPHLVDVPVIFTGNRKALLTLPLSQGDEGMLVFSDRCIDAFWENGGVQSQLELRSHDISDAQFFPGNISQPNVPPNISATRAQLRNFAGDTYIEIDADGQAINGVAPGGFNFNGAIIDSGGNISTPGGVTAGAGSGDQVTLQHHEHPTAALGAPSPPTPGT